MPGKKLSRSHRKATARLLYFCFHTLSNLTTVIAKLDHEIIENLRESEIEEFAKLKQLTFRLGERWRSLAWVLEGYNAEKGPPSRANK